MRAFFLILAVGIAGSAQATEQDMAKLEGTWCEIGTKYQITDKLEPAHPAEWTFDSNKMTTRGLKPVGYSVENKELKIENPLFGDWSFDEIGKKELILKGQYGGYVFLEKGQCLLENGQALIQDVTKFHNAAFLNNIDVVQKYLDSGINPDISVIGGITHKTALHLAAQEGRLDIARLLLDAGANLNAKNYKGLTALELAKEYGHEDMIKLLQQKGNHRVSANHR